eukprot:scaffold618_cov514-Pavlova_lutheri.AAC.1
MRGWLNEKTRRLGPGCDASNRHELSCRLEASQVGSIEADGGPLASDPRPFDPPAAPFCSLFSLSSVLSCSFRPV